MRKFRIALLILLVLVNSCSKEDEIRELNEIVANLQTNITNLNSKINDYQNQITQLINETNYQSNQINTLNDQINELDIQIQNYINEIQVLTESNQLLQSENNSLTSQLTELQEQIYSIQSQSGEEGIYLFNKIDILEPPFAGSLWGLPDLITSNDYSIYSSFQYFGIQNRLMYDQSIPDFVEYPAHIMNINFGDGLTIEFEIYEGFTYNEAIVIKDKYAPLIGQLGKSLRQHIKSFEFMKESVIASAQRSEDLSYANITLHPLWIEEVVETYPGGNRTEELLIHESAHLSIDPFVYGDENWNNAVELDGNYISNYAMDFSDREDIAETFQAYIAVKYFPERISNSLRDTILSVCLNRFKYFDTLNLDLLIYK